MYSGCLSQELATVAGWCLNSIKKKEKIVFKGFVCLSTSKTHAPLHATDMPTHIQDEMQALASRRDQSGYGYDPGKAPDISEDLDLNICVFWGLLQVLYLVVLTRSI